MASKLPNLELTDLDLSIQLIDREIEEVASRLRGMVATGSDGVPIARGIPTPAIESGPVSSTLITPSPLVQQKVTKPVAMPEKFSGKSNYKDWLAQFLACKDLNNWTDAQACQFLAILLSGSALQVFADLDEGSRKNFKLILDTLKSRFDPDLDVSVHWARLKDRTRNKGESLPELAGNIRRLVAKAYPHSDKDSVEQIAVQYFVDALDNREIKLQVRRSKPKSLSEAMKIALDEESFFKVEGKTKVSAVGADNTENFQTL